MYLFQVRVLPHHRCVGDPNGIKLLFCGGSTSRPGGVNMHQCMVSAPVLFHSGGPVSTGGRFEYI